MTKTKDLSLPLAYVAPSKIFLGGVKPKWRKYFKVESEKLYFRELSQFLSLEAASGKIIYPPPSQFFRVFQELDIDEVKIVILGQDPYHGKNQALGRAFAVPNDHFPKPPSLVNIFKEIESDLRTTIDRTRSDLSGWTEEGVFLLNTVLSVRAAEAFSHRKKGWEEFTDHVIRALNDREKPVVFILWGSAAISKKALLDLKKHIVYESAHPSPLSAYRGFFGSKIFSRANEALIELGEKPIDWCAT